MILSNLKTLLETGTPLPAFTFPPRLPASSRPIPTQEDRDHAPRWTGRGWSVASVTLVVGFIAGGGKPRPYKYTAVNAALSLLSPPLPTDHSA